MSDCGDRLTLGHGYDEVCDQPQGHSGRHVGQGATWRDQDVRLEQSEQQAAREREVQAALGPQEDDERFLGSRPTRALLGSGDIKPQGVNEDEKAADFEARVAKLVNPPKYGTDLILHSDSRTIIKSLDAVRQRHQARQAARIAEAENDAMDITLSDGGQ